MSLRTREDPQKQLVYEAEWGHSAYRYRNFRSRDAVQRWTNFIVGQPWFGRNWPHMKYHPVSIYDFGDERKCTSFAVTNTIDMSPWSWKKLIICHELAHLCNVDSEMFQVLRQDELFRRTVKRGAASHGKKFATIYLKIVKSAMGKEDERELRRNFNFLGVQYDKSPRRTGGQRERSDAVRKRAAK